ncbi:hypothetical protein BTUL_0162g00220 [Botrytis tulipae]|uniref:Uncharacterized protein n=1 Tax=Botrytis tulipae TaxID=87230 RepID=A0A4Z1EBE8_9HELO|nr:hypothetical protein BTUL_0162g00220 [Botrytis tulipae]
MELEITRLKPVYESLVMRGRHALNNHAEYRNGIKPPVMIRHDSSSVQAPQTVFAKPSEVFVDNATRYVYIRVQPATLPAIPSILDSHESRPTLGNGNCQWEGWVLKSPVNFLHIKNAT